MFIDYGADYAHSMLRSLTPETVNDPQLSRHAAARLAAPGLAVPWNAFLATNAALREAVAPELNGDLSLDRRSPLAARVLAAKRLFGSKAAGSEDEQLLEFANAVHGRAARNPLDEEAACRSMVLWNQESIEWARENGEEQLGVDAETRLGAYRDVWAVALNPPPAPRFKSRTALAEEYVDKYHPADVISPATPPLPVTTPAPRDLLVASYRDHSDVITQYYSQFHTYIESALDRNCDISAIAVAGLAGLGRLAVEYKPKQAWAIAGVTLSIPMAQIPTAMSVLLWKVAGRRSEPAFVFRMPDDTFGAVGPKGVFHRLTGEVLDSKGDLLASALAPVYAETLVRMQASSSGDRLRLPPRDGNNVEPLSILTVDARRLDTSKAARSIKEMIAGQVRKEMLAAVKAWKADNYHPSTLETFLGAMIPFYETVHKIRFDPGYDLKFEDIAVDLISLSLTLAAIGISALGGAKGIVAAARAAQAARASGAAAMASAAIRTTLNGFKTSTFLRGAARELTDFVVPVFSTADILQAVKRRGAKVLPYRNTFRQLDSVVSTLKDETPGEMLQAIYDLLAKTRAAGPNLAPDDIKAFMDAGAARRIPERVFRGQAMVGDKDLLWVPWSAEYAADPDLYLCDCIRHTSRTSGSAGMVLSLSTDSAVAGRFAQARPRSQLLAIDTSKYPDDFRTIEHILKYDGPRLVKEGKIKPGTLASAIKHAINQKEKEVFFVKGSIPDELILELPLWNQPQSTAAMLRI